MWWKFLKLFNKGLFFRMRSIFSRVMAYSYIKKYDIILQSANLTSIVFYPFSLQKPNSLSHLLLKLYSHHITMVDAFPSIPLHTTGKTNSVTVQLLLLRAPYIDVRHSADHLTKHYLTNPLLHWLAQYKHIKLPPTQKHCSSLPHLF